MDTIQIRSLMCFNGPGDRRARQTEPLSSKSLSPYTFVSANVKQKSKLRQLNPSSFDDLCGSFRAITLKHLGTGEFARTCPGVP